MQGVLAKLDQATTRRVAVEQARFPGCRGHRQHDPEGFRTRVLDVAANLFQTHGYQATSIKDVMQATDVSGGALDHHFPTKKQLALAVIRDRVAPAVRQTWIVPVLSASSLEK